jgi:HK97 gp10 family phage protein
MPQVKGTSGNFVSYEIEGIRETIEKLQRMGAQINSNIDIALVQSANLIQNEVKESIAGSRDELKSVDTGRFINSIAIKKKNPKELEVGTNVPYAKFLEYGTSYLRPRRHFRNTILRNQSKVNQVISEAVRNSIK